jgi:hypothetical protein
MYRHFANILLLILLCGLTGHAQSDISVKASIDRNKILIGEKIELTLEANMPLGTAPAWFPLDSLAHFEFISKGKIDTSLSNNQVSYRQKLLITSFDSGRWSVPALPLSIGNRDYLTDSLEVSVAFTNYDPKQDYHDIHDIVETTASQLSYLTWVFAGLSILALLLLIYLLRKKVQRRTAIAPQVVFSSLSPREEAVQALKVLNEKAAAGAIQTKAYHTGMNEIFRHYLHRRASLSSMQKTSAELMIQLQPLGLPNTAFTAVAQALRMNDAVKFARFQPGAAEDRQAANTIQDAIEQLDRIITS